MSEEKYTCIDGREFLVNGNNSKLFIKTIAFQQWMERMNPDIEMDYLELRDAYLVNEGKSMLFATVLGVNAKINNKPLSSYAFLRSDSVTMLPIIYEKESGEIYTIVTEQTRFPHGDICIELPAGMLDDQIGFTGVAAKEIQEELDEIARPEDLIHLATTSISGGGCSERMQFVAFEMVKNKIDILKIQGKKTGNIDENEDIKLHVIPFNSAAEVIKALQEFNVVIDNKMLSAITLWRIYKQ